MSETENPPFIETTVFQGKVNTVYDNVAFCTLSLKGGKDILIQWNAESLSSVGIVKGSRFVLTLTVGDGIEPKFVFDLKGKRELSQEELRMISQQVKGWLSERDLELNTAKTKVD